MSAKRIFVAYLTLAFATPAAADLNDDWRAGTRGVKPYHRPGSYVSLGGGAAIEDFKNVGGLEVKNGWRINPTLGYRFHPLIAAEVEGSYFDGFSIDVLGNEIEGDAWHFMPNVKLFAPWNFWAQPWVKAGVGYGEIDFSGISGGDAVWQTGVGLDLYATDHLVIGFEADRWQGTGDVRDVRFWNVGANFTIRFE